MQTEKPFSCRDVDCPPPRAGRTFSIWDISGGKLRIYSINPDSGARQYRQLAAERDANLSRQVGENTGEKFTTRSRRDTLAVFGLATLIIAALLYIMAARTAQHLDGWHCRPSDRATTNGRPLCGAPR